MPELYIYYRVPAGNESAALAATLAMQKLLRERHPQLQARLLRRPETAADGLQTWMEAYALPGRGIDASLRQEIEAAALTWAALIDGPRHCEVFEVFEVCEPCA
ncbi:MAG TPA: DUF4936 family protein [Methylibium sp.]